MHKAANSQDLDCLLLELSSKLNSPKTCKSMDDLMAITTEYLRIVEHSTDLRTICTAVDSIIETHSEDDSIEVFKQCRVLEVLQAVCPKLLPMIRQKLKSKTASDEEADVLNDVNDNLEAFIGYKKSYV
jgi:hypothetical protein